MHSKTFLFIRRIYVFSSLKSQSTERTILERNESDTQFQEKVNVWAGILGNHVVEMIFIRGNLTGDFCRMFLGTETEP